MSAAVNRGSGGFSSCVTCSSPAASGWEVRIQVLRFIAGPHYILPCCSGRATRAHGGGGGDGDGDRDKSVPGASIAVPMDRAGSLCSGKTSEWHLQGHHSFPRTSIHPSHDSLDLEAPAFPWGLSQEEEEDYGPQATCHSRGFLPLSCACTLLKAPASLSDKRGSYRNRGAARQLRSLGPKYKYAPRPKELFLLRCWPHSPPVLALLGFSRKELQTPNVPQQCLCLLGGATLHLHFLPREWIGSSGLSALSSHPHAYT